MYRQTDSVSSACVQWVRVVTNASEMEIVLNWTEELKRLVPAK